MKYLWLFLVALCLAISTGLGCGGDSGGDGDGGTSDDDDDDDDNDNSTDADSDSDSDGDSDTDTDTDTDADGDTDDCVDESSSCADALELTLGDTEGVESELCPPSDADYFILKGAKAGDYLRFYTDANPFDSGTRVDTVMELYNSDGSTKLATGDDQIPRRNTDSEILYRVPADGDICVKIIEFFVWAGRPEPEKGWLNYNVLVDEIDDSQPGIVAESESNDDTDSADVLDDFVLDTDPNLAGERYSTLFYGAIADADDVDFFKFTMGGSQVRTAISIFPAGPGFDVSGPNGYQSGYGSTFFPGTLKIVADGNVVSSLDFQAATGVTTIHYPTSGGEEVEMSLQLAGGDSAGSNDFYFVRVVNDDWDNNEEVEPNDAIGTATELVSGEGGLLLGYIGTKGTFDGNDVDYYSFAVENGGSVGLNCSAARNGSGMSGTTFAVLNSSGEVLQEETEVIGKDIYWSDAASLWLKPSMAQIDIAETGTNYLRVTAGTDVAGVDGNFYRCAVTSLAAPAP